MIDWNVATSTGVRWARPGPAVSMAEARKVVAELRRLAIAVQEPVREVTQLPGLGDGGRIAVVDRPGWIRANVDGFRVVLEPLVEQMRERGSAPPPGSVIGTVGSRVTGMQAGLILAYLAGRVLGQFRRWVCLHEETHRAQFTSVPWLRPYVQQQMTEFLLASDLDPASILDRLRSAADAVAGAVRGGGESLIEAIQTPRQREILDRLTAVMTLVEGHGDYVMDAVGPKVVPSVEEIRAKFSARRHSGSRIEQAIRRILGIDLKMKQYEQGSRFVKTVVDEAGMEVFNKVWTSPETLPTRDEIASPRSWLDRVGGLRGIEANGHGAGGSETNGSGANDSDAAAS